jgi:hypothetical protein
MELNGPGDLSGAVFHGAAPDGGGIISPAG